VNPAPDHVGQEYVLVEDDIEWVKIKVTEILDGWVSKRYVETVEVVVEEIVEKTPEEVPEEIPEEIVEEETPVQ